MLRTSLFIALLVSLPCTAGAQSCYLGPHDGPTTQPGDKLGFDVAVGGKRVFMGAPARTTNGANSGSVGVLRWDGTGFVPEAELLAPDGMPDDEFGYTIVSDGNVTVVSSPFADLGGNSRGAAYVFRRSGFSWSMEQKLTASNGADFDQFGQAVDLDGDRIAIGAPQKGGTGAVYIFERSAGVWSETAELTPVNADPGDLAGWSVALDGEFLVAGSPMAFLTVGFQTGAVTRWRIFGPNWVQQGTIIPTGIDGSRFGSSLQAVGDKLIVGAPGVPTIAGRAWVFDHSTGPYLFDGPMLVPSNSAIGDRFGVAVAITDGQAIVGAGGTDTATLFDDTGAAWVESASLSDGTAGNAISVAINELVAAVGEPFAASGGLGHLYGVGRDCNANGVADLCDVDSGTSTDLNANGAPDECDCVPVNYCVANANSTGAPADMSSGASSLSIAANALTLTASPVPNEPGIFFYGPFQISVPFGDGVRCVGGTVNRLNPPSVGAGNVLTREVDLSNLPTGALAPLDQWNFQCWFRDPAGGPSGFNLTDGLQLTFCP